MSEESERMEINEAALEDVSGGSGLDSAVKNLCTACRARPLSKYRCTGGANELWQYLQEHGTDSVQRVQDCPFHARA